MWRLMLGIMLMFGGWVYSQDYPNKPIRIVTSGIGGSSDFAARLIAQGISGPLGQPVIVDNRGSLISIVTVAKASPDGYTLLLQSASLWVGPFLRDNVPYDPIRDFSPITLAVSAPNVVVVHSSLPVKSLKELIALAKARPGELNYASGEAGTSPHLAAELFKAMARVNIVRITYKSGAAQMSDLLGGHVQLTFANATTVTPHLKSGRLRALAVTSARPSPLAPGLPTVAASGVPGYESGTMTAIFAPAKTPETIINRLNQEVVPFLKMPETKEKVLNSGAEVIGSSPEQLAQVIKSEMARIGKVIKDAGIKAD